MSKRVRVRTRKSSSTEAKRAPRRGGRRIYVAALALWMAALPARSLGEVAAEARPAVQGSTAMPAASALPAVERPIATPAAGARDEIAALRAQIAHHDALYHRDAAPEISDYDYDQLKQRLAALERSSPAAALEVAPLPELGDDRSGLFQTVRHRERMLSLDKTYAAADVRVFDARVSKQLGAREIDYVVEPKFDGFAVSVTYENGSLVRAITRGNGRDGDDITANVRRIAGLPRTLRAAASTGSAGMLPRLIEVRGEIYVGLADFARIAAEREAAGEPPFANPRNLAAGTIRQLDANAVVTRSLQVVFYAVGACEPIGALPATQRELHDRFRAWGLPSVGEVWPAKGAEGLWRAIEAVRAARPGFAFPTDGAVVKLNSLAQQRELGAGESAPRWAIAYKFAPERAETQLRAITIQVGRTGVLTPVAELAPIPLGGSTIARATLHNRDEIARRDIRVGDYVFVEKAGEIIPAIVGVNLARRPTTARAFEFPSVCPECRTAVVSNAGEVAVRCANASCPAQLRRRLEHFASKACVDIDGLGPVTIAALVDRGVVKGIPDLYRLRRGDLLTQAKLGEKSADRLLVGINASKRAELWRLVYGLGIPQVGAVAARELARRFGSLAALANASSTSTAGAGRSPTADANDPAGRAAADFFAQPGNRALIADLIAAGVEPMAPSVATSAGCAEKTFVLTGTLPTLTRAVATARIEAAGGKVGTSVSRTTDFVIVGADAGTKLERARALGVKTIDEAELLRMLGPD
jgi:DNA ligase (NAD+)